MPIRVRRPCGPRRGMSRPCRSRQRRIREWIALRTPPRARNRRNRLRSEGLRCAPGRARHGVNQRTGGGNAARVLARMRLTRSLCRLRAARLVARRAGVPATRYQPRRSRPGRYGVPRGDPRGRDPVPPNGCRKLRRPRTRARGPPPNGCRQLRDRRRGRPPPNGCAGVRRLGRANPPPHGCRQLRRIRRPLRGVTGRLGPDFGRVVRLPPNGWRGLRGRAWPRRGGRREGPVRRPPKGWIGVLGRDRPRAGVRGRPPNGCRGVRRGAPARRPPNG